MPSETETRPVRPPNFLGRSVRVVGPQASPDPFNEPHARVRRGEIGPAAQTYSANRMLRDPIDRVTFNTATGEWRNVLSAVIARSRKGAINPDRLANTDPVKMAAHIKRVATAFGADAIGIAPTVPEYVYDGGARRNEDDSMLNEQGDESPEGIAKRYPYAICMMTSWDYEMGRAHRHWIGDSAYHFCTMRRDILAYSLCAYLKELGYEARMEGAHPMPMMLLAGVGELGRNGLVISEKFGARGNPVVILTDLLMATDSPVDIGVADFCQVCKKCAVTCPTNSISHEGKQVINGVEKFAINWKTCYGLRPYVSNFWLACLTCIAVCPYTKPSVWWRTLTIRSLKALPHALRPLLIKPLIKLDDRLWGRFPRKRVKWLGYDTAFAPEEKACLIAGCSCKQEASMDPARTTGVYMPVKENMRRFEKNNGVQSNRPS